MVEINYSEEFSKLKGVLPDQEIRTFRKTYGDKEGLQRAKELYNKRLEYQKTYPQETRTIPIGKLEKEISDSKITSKTPKELARAILNRYINSESVYISKKEKKEIIYKTYGSRKKALDEIEKTGNIEEARKEISRIRNKRSYKAWEEKQKEEDEKSKKRMEEELKKLPRYCKFSDFQKASPEKFLKLFGDVIKGRKDYIPYSKQKEDSKQN